MPLPIDLKLKFNQQVAQVITLSPGAIVMAVILEKLTVGFFPGQYTFDLYAMLSQQGQIVVITDARVGSNERVPNQEQTYQQKETTQEHGAPFTKSSVENTSSRNCKNKPDAQHQKKCIEVIFYG